jgi:hypothetical protein
MTATAMTISPPTNATLCVNFHAVRVRLLPISKTEVANIQGTIDTAIGEALDELSTKIGAYASRKGLAMVGIHPPVITQAPIARDGGDTALMSVTVLQKVDFLQQAQP